VAGVTAAEVLAAVAACAVALGAGLIVTSRRVAESSPARPPSLLHRRLMAAFVAITSDAVGWRRRWAAWFGAGVVTMVVTGWPAAGLAVAVVGVALPWLLGSAGVARERLERLEALEGWCRRMADTLAGGGAVGLSQAIQLSAVEPDPLIARAVTQLASRLRAGDDVGAAVRGFADDVDDRAGDTAAAALLLALIEQTSGTAVVLRQLASGIARDIRARREVEAARAESRQSVTMLLIIQAGLLGLLALVPGFSAPYSSPTGQLVMATLLTGSTALLVWLRRIAIGTPAPRFLGATVTDRVVRR
jgi:tight adherence protein B